MVEPKKFNPNLRKRGKTKTQGSNRTQVFETDNYSAYASAIETYKKLAAFETAVSLALDILVGYLVGGLNSITHPDQKVQKYLQENIDAIDNDSEVPSFRLQLSTAIKELLIAGFFVGEKIYKVTDEGYLLVRELAPRDPCSIRIRLDKNGEITENEPAYYEPIYTSGLYQNVPHEPVDRKLSLWKHVYLVYNRHCRRYLGVSALQGAYRHHVEKEGINALYIEWLDKASDPLTFLLLADSPTDISIEDSQGNHHLQMAIDRIRQQVNDNYRLVQVPYTDRELKPEILRVDRVDPNFDQVYLRNIRKAEVQMVRALRVPYGLVSSILHNESLQVTEREMEIFNNTLISLNEEIVVPLIAQLFSNLIMEVFGKEQAKVVPRMVFSAMPRPEDRTSLVQLITGITNQGWINPTNSEDWSFVRGLSGMPIRPQTSKDTEFIKQLLIYPRQPESKQLKAESSELEGQKQNAQNKENKQDAPLEKDSTEPTEKPTPPEDALSPEQTRDRSTEGKVNGKGRRGRPPGKTSPLNKPR